MERREQYRRCLGHYIAGVGIDGRAVLLAQRVRQLSLRVCFV
jgi:hypothetical protein